MLELYLSTIIVYCVIVIAFGLSIGWTTLVQTDKNLDLFGGFKQFKLTSLFEWTFSTFAKILKAVTGLDIDPPALKK